MTDTVKLFLCSTCAGDDRDGDLIAIETAISESDLADRVEVAMVACMGACETPVSVGLQGPGRASYVFAGVCPTIDSADIVATCRTYLQSPAGWIADARPCGRLRHCLRARLPALESSRSVCSGGAVDHDDLA